MRRRQRRHMASFQRGRSTCSSPPSHRSRLDVANAKSCHQHAERFGLSTSPLRDVWPGSASLMLLMTGGKVSIEPAALTPMVRTQNVSRLPSWICSSGPGDFGTRRRHAETSAWQTCCAIAICWKPAQEARYVLAVECRSHQGEIARACNTCAATGTALRLSK